MPAVAVCGHMSTDQVTREVVDETAVITLDNPEMRNALTIEMAHGIKDALEDIEETDARCVVLQGSEDAFCAGGDIQSMLEAVSADADMDAMVEEVGKPVNRTVQDVYECPLPTIAKVDGPAYGAGGSMAVACDMVLASERAELSFGFQRIGLSIDSGTSYLLPRLVGENTAKQLVFTDAALDAEEAADHGLVQEVFPTDEFDERAQAVIDQVAGGPTVALTNTKSLIQNGLDRTMDEAIDHEVESLKEVFRTDDFAEGVSAFIEQRSPEFDGK
jgi:2-(1,2-epoxy-1,2-dihydrophenyl)acetyl-CoA isomerase